MAEKRKIEKHFFKNTKKVVVELTGIRSSFLLCSMAESGWHASVVTREYLRNLVSKGYMIAVEFAACLVPTGLVSPASAKGFIVACAAFYEWGFGFPSHRFLRSLLRSYGLELHHLTPSRILHVAAFLTLCEAFLWVEPPLNLWSHFFQVLLRPNLGVGVASLGSVDISIRTGLGTEPYFFVPLPDPLVGWWKAWFLLKDEAEAPLPTFMGGCPIPHPNWEFSMTKSDFLHLQTC
jgi:hypothetical protein